MADPPPDDEPVVLGREYAAAEEAERRHRRVAREPSPLDGTGYDYWRGEYDLLRCPPVPTDQAVADLHGQLAAADSAGWAAVRDRLTMEDLYTVLAFSRRTAVLARREGRPSRAAAAVDILALVDSERVDWRDTVLAAALATAVLRHLSPAAAGRVSAAAHNAEPRTAVILQRFVAPSAADANLASWGWMPVETPDGWGLVGWGYSPFEPTIDLLTAALRIRAMLSAGDYYADRIEAGADLPSVWLPGAPADAADAVVERSRACVTVGARLRPHVHGTADAQQLSVFVVEAADEADASVLAQWAEADAGGTHRALSWRRGRLFVLLIARSFVAGVAAYETDETLARFREPVAAIVDGAS